MEEYSGYKNGYILQPPHKCMNESNFYQLDMPPIKKTLKFTLILILGKNQPNHTTQVMLL